MVGKPIPRLEDYVEKVGQATYIIKLDLLRGYREVPFSAKAKEVSTFVMLNGLYQFNVMPFDMKNAPATFQRCTYRVVAEFNNCAVHIDDIVIFSHSWKDHMVHLARLFERLREAKLAINLAKTEFAKAEVVFLGHEVRHGRNIKIKAIEGFSRPSLKKR
eukprot:g29321.t1